MTEIIKLEAQKRGKEESAKALLRQGFVSAVLYGPKVKENKTLKLKANELKKVLTAAGEATLIDLSIDGKAEGKVLIKDEQRDAIKGSLIHVDLYEVDMTKEIHAEVPLKFIGESKAVKDMAGVLIRSINEVEVKCLPSALISHIDVDVSVLDDFEKSIKIHDLVLPSGVKLVHETDDVVATVAAPKTEEELAAEEAATATPAEVAIVGKEDKAEEGEEAEEDDKDKK